MLVIIRFLASMRYCGQLVFVSADCALVHDFGLYLGPMGYLQNEH